MGLLPLSRNCSHNECKSHFQIKKNKKPNTFCNKKPTYQKVFFCILPCFMTTPNHIMMRQPNNFLKDVCDHHHHSPDLTPNEYHLFQEMKKRWGDQRFNSREELQHNKRVNEQAATLLGKLCVLLSIIIILNSTYRCMYLIYNCFYVKSEVDKKSLYFIKFYENVEF